MSKLFYISFCFAFCFQTTAFASSGKTTDFTIVYGIIALVSLVTLLGYYFIIKQKSRWLTLLFSAVFVINTGYWLLSISSDLNFALWANRIAYLGSVCLPFTMYMIIARVCKTEPGKKVVAILSLVSVLVFLIAASPGYCRIYYEDVSYEVVDGMAILAKSYGPLHFVYLLYLAVYFFAMIVTIAYAILTKRIESGSFAVCLLCAVAVNIAVWFVEQMADFKFEYLSMSYIITEIFLLNMYVVFNENVTLAEKLSSQRNVTSEKKENIVEKELMDYVIENIPRLTPTEKRIYNLYCAGKTTTEVMEELGIKETTLKFHNSNIYGKLGVKSKKQLLECVRLIDA